MSMLMDTCPFRHTTHVVTSDEKGSLSEGGMW